MKNLNLTKCLMLCGLLALTALYSCKKAGVTTDNSVDAKLAAAMEATQSIQLSAATTSSTSSASQQQPQQGPPPMVGVTSDAVFAMHAYPPGGKKDSVTFASLPASIGTYLTANYAGYTFKKAFKVSTAAGVLDGYVVVIMFNSKPVAVKFDATGTFVAVLEQCEGHDLGGGPGWHPGGRFDDRDGKHRDTVAISALPTVVKTYLSTAYPTDTLLHVALNMDGSYSIISANKGLFVTTVSATGTLINRVQIYPHPNNRTAVTETALLSAITSYLTTTYPGYVFDKAFAEKAGTTVLGYDVFITVNGTRHAIEFDATGKFVKNIVIR